MGKKLELYMKKLCFSVENIMIVINGKWGRSDQELRIIEILFSEVNRIECNAAEIELRDDKSLIVFGKKLQKVNKKKFKIFYKVTEKEIDDFISQNFYDEYHLNFEFKACLGLLWAKLGKGTMTSTLYSFSEKVNEVNFSEFYDHVKGKNPWLDNEFLDSFEMPTSHDSTRTRKASYFSDISFD